MQNNHRISIEENNDNHEVMLFSSSTTSTSTTTERPNFVTPRAVTKNVTPVTKTVTKSPPMTTVSTKIPRSPKKPKKMYTEPTSEAVIEQLRKDYRKRVKHVFKKDPPKKKSRLNSSKYMNHHKLNGPTPNPPVATTSRG